MAKTSAVSFTIISWAAPKASEEPNASAEVRNARQFDQKAVLPVCVSVKQSIPHDKNIARYNNSAGISCVCWVAALAGWASAATNADTIKKDRALFINSTSRKLMLSGYNDDGDNRNN